MVVIASGTLTTDRYSLVEVFLRNYGIAQA